MPEVPDDEPLERRLVPLLVLGIAGCSLAIGARRGRAHRRQSVQ